MGGTAVADRPITPAASSSGDGPDAAWATAAAAAEAARVAAQPLDPATRAAEGFRIAAGSALSASPATQAVADAGANARTAMSRTDLPPATQQQLTTVLERLGNAVIDGKLDPHMNGEFRQQLYHLATAAPGGSAFREALAHMTRAAQVLDQVPLARGTQLAYDAKAGGGLGRSGLPGLDVPLLDADLYYQRRDGTLAIESSKYGVNTFASTVKNSAGGKSEQLARQARWEAQATPAQPREARYFMLDAREGFAALMNDKNLGELGQRIAQPDQRNIVIGDRAYSLNELKALDAAGKPLADAHVARARATHLAGGQPAATFKTGAAYAEFYKAALASPDAAMKAFGLQIGQPVKDLTPMARPAIGSLRQGAAAGAAGSGVIALTQLAFKDGQVTWRDLGHASAETLRGGALGAVMARAEKAVVPIIEQRIGSGVVARTAVARVAGATAVGTVVTTAMSAYENRAGLARGDTRAIGNVAADTAVGVVAVGASSVAGAAAAGALAGSVVPGLGTAVGFAVGLGVGVAVTYGAHLSGARDAIASGAGKVVDWVKGWF